MIVSVLVFILRQYSIVFGYHSVSLRCVVVFSDGRLPKAGLTCVCARLARDYSHMIYLFGYSGGWFPFRNVVTVRGLIGIYYDTKPL